METVTVWYMPHDDPAVGLIVNDREDMEMNFSDMEDEGTARGTFDEYLDSWDSATIPALVWLSGDDAAIRAAIGVVVHDTAGDPHPLALDKTGENPRVCLTCGNTVEG